MTISPVASFAAARAATGLVSRAGGALSDAVGSFADLLRIDVDAGSGVEQTVDPAAAVTRNDASQIEYLKQETNVSLDRFHQLLAQRLAEAGIDTSIRYQLQSDGAGPVRLTDDHPYRRRIEQVLASDPELTGLFRHIEETYRLMESIERYADFEHQLAGGPMVAGAEFSRRSDREDSSQLTLTVNGGEVVEVAFQ